MKKSHVSDRVLEPTPAQMKEFFAQVQSGRITKETFQQFLCGQASFPSYTVTVNHDQTVKQLIKAGKYDWINDDITDINFPSDEEGKAQLEIFLLSFNRHISSEDAIEKIDKQGLRPATLKELLGLGSQHPDLQRKNPIVALGSTWRFPRGYLYVLVLYRNGSRRRLDLTWFEGGWSSRWRFAVVRN